MDFIRQEDLFEVRSDLWLLTNQTNVLEKGVGNPSRCPGNLVFTKVGYRRRDGQTIQTQLCLWLKLSRVPRHKKPLLCHVFHVMKGKMASWQIVFNSCIWTGSRDNNALLRERRYTLNSVQFNSIVSVFCFWQTSQTSYHTHSTIFLRYKLRPNGNWTKTLINLVFKENSFRPMPVGTLLWVFFSYVIQVC